MSRLPSNRPPTPAPLPKGNIRKGWEVLCKHLSAPNTHLDRYVKTWQLFDTANDLMLRDPGDWEASLFPILRFELEGSEGSWYNEITHKTSVRFGITLGLSGLVIGEATDFWEHVVSRFYPGERTLFHEMKQYGFMSYTVTTVGITPKKLIDGTGQIVKGYLSALYEFRTPY